MLRIIKDYGEKDVKGLKKSIRDRHGDFEKLKQRAHRTGCRDPELVDDHMILDALNKGGTYSYEYISRTPGAVSNLTPRRVNLLSHLSKNDVDSIKELAESLRRDYKNVYDDVKALEEYRIIVLESEGKKKKPVLNADRVIIEFD